MLNDEGKPITIKHTTNRQLAGFEEDEIGVSRIANVIESIISNLDDKPFVIGLNSNWGTGKTLVPHIGS